MQLPTAHCPHCKRRVLVYQGVASCADPLTAPLHLYCADCDARLDRFGEQPELAEEPMAKLVLEGYQDFDSLTPALETGCRTEKGCDGCPKLPSRPF